VGTLRRIAIVIVVTAAGAVVGAAASLNLTSSSLGAATTSTPRCTTAALTVLQNLTAANVVSVTVGAIPAACGGATLQATVNNGVTNSGGSAVVPGGGGSVTVTIAVPTAVTASEETDLVLVGP
jgi:hypothetical protein